MAISMLTLNTWKGDGAYRNRMHHLRQALFDGPWSICCFQEVFDAEGEGRSTVRHLEAALPAHCAYVTPARAKLRQLEASGELLPSTSGLMIMTTFPSAGALEVLALPDCEQDRDRRAQILTLQTPVGLLRLVNVHLTHLRQGDALRKAQVRALLADLSARERAYPVAATVIAGDFNCEAASPALAPLHEAGGRFLPSGAPPAPGTAGRFSREGFGRTLDHVVLLSDQWSYLRHETLFAHCPTGPQALSDHAAVSACFVAPSAGAIA
ncbi:MAG: endonuclease/exonuclease/phosphatase family protein [Proteobacteria bacterium]|nr:endonuclease/exonuclease/phosphatase family protein [Pseudomonadota bacterium]